MKARTVVGRGEKRQLGDPGSDVTSTGREEEKEKGHKITDGMSNQIRTKISFWKSNPARSTCRVQSSRHTKHTQNHEHETGRFWTRQDLCWRHHTRVLCRRRSAKGLQTRSPKYHIHICLSYEQGLLGS